MNRCSVQRAGLAAAAAAIVSVCAMCLTACDRPPAPARSAAPAEATGPVICTFYPTRFFAERIAGDLVPVECPLPAEADPAEWRPSPEAVARMQQAALLVVNGAGFEPWLSSAAIPFSKVVDTTRPFAAEYITLERITHSHGAGGQHTHQGTDGHTWLDPINAKRQAQQIAEAMARAWPAHEREFRSNLTKLESSLDALDARFRKLAPRLSTATILASHPAYNYVARRYGLAVKNVDLPPDAVPTADQLSSLDKHFAGQASATRCAIVLFEQTPVPELRAALADRWKASAILVDPGENPPADVLARQDFLSIMNENLDRLEQACDQADGSH